MKAYLNADEIDIVEEALIRHGAFLQDLPKRIPGDLFTQHLPYDTTKQEQLIKTIIQKLRTIQSLSKSKNLSVEPAR